MTEFLVRRFIKDYGEVQERSVRMAYGSLAGEVGIAANFLLFFVKFAIGMLTKSVSVTADAFNNLSDVAGSLISLIGAKLAGKPADREHPFGHGRIEYLAAFAVAFLVLNVGFLLLKNSVLKILHPEELAFAWVPVLILCLSVLVKLWLSRFNQTLGKRVNSKVMLAAAADARSDMLATGAAIAALFVYAASGFNIDGLIGLMVSFFILKSGYEIASDTLGTIIGGANDAEICGELSKFVESYPGVIGTHDLMVHSYGPASHFASIHVEVSDDMNLEAAHMLLDEIEKAVMERYHLVLVTHADPVDIHDERTKEVRETIRAALSEENNAELSFHDARLHCLITMEHSYSA